MLQSFDGVVCEQVVDETGSAATGAEDAARKDSVFLNTLEAAKLVRMSPRSLERMRNQGTGPKYCKVGGGRTKRGRVVYRRSDVIAWLTAIMFSGTSDYGR